MIEHKEKATVLGALADLIKEFTNTVSIFNVGIRAELEDLLEKREQEKRRLARYASTDWRYDNQ